MSARPTGKNVNNNKRVHQKERKTVQVKRGKLNEKERKDPIIIYYVVTSRFRPFFFFYVSFVTSFARPRSGYRHSWSVPTRLPFKLFLLSSSFSTWNRRFRFVNPWTGKPKGGLRKTASIRQTHRVDFNVLTGALLPHKNKILFSRSFNFIIPLWLFFYGCRNSEPAN